MTTIRPQERGLTAVVATAAAAAAAAATAN